MSIRPTGNDKRSQRQQLLLARLVERAVTLEPGKLELILAFSNQIAAFADPDAIEDFLYLREDPTLGSILQLAARLSDESKEQLLFQAEESYMAENAQPASPEEAEALPDLLRNATKACKPLAPKRS